MGPERYLRMVTRASNQLKEMGANRIVYLTSPHELASQSSYLHDLLASEGTRSPIVHEVVASDVSFPIELRLLTSSRPGKAIVVMPYTSSLISLACLYGEVTETLISVIASHDGDPQLKSLADHMHRVAESVNRGLDVLVE